MYGRANLDETAEPYRHKMVAGLIAEEHIRLPAWRVAFSTVPRHVFLPHFFNQQGNSGIWEPVTAETTSEPSWLEQVYSNRTCVTQLDGSIEATNVEGPVEGLATSSSTEPGLMADMLEALELEQGMTVAEIGTGTGYNAALLSAFLGDQHVWSVEIDRKVSTQAKEQLSRAGYAPKLKVGDGESLKGLQVDRLIATCSFPTIPEAWFDIVKPGGIIIVCLYVKPFGMAIVKARANRDGAIGEFVFPNMGFMQTRRDQPNGPVWLPSSEEIQAAPSRSTPWAPEALFTSPVDFLGGWMLGNASFYPEYEGRGTLIVDHDSNSWAAFGGSEAEPTVREGGKRRIWQALEGILRTWQRSGTQYLEGFSYKAVKGSEGYDALVSTNALSFQRYSVARGRFKPAGMLGGR